MLQSVLCITTNKYLVHVLVVLLHARFSVVGPILFYWPPFFFGSSLYRSTTTLPDMTAYEKTRHMGSACIISFIVSVLLEEIEIMTPTDRLTFLLSSTGVSDAEL